MLLFKLMNAWMFKTLYSATLLGTAKRKAASHFVTLALGPMAFPVDNQEAGWRNIYGW